MKKERNSVIASRKIEHGVVKVEDGLLAAFMLVLTFSIIFQVVCRYVLKVSSPWCEELARYLFIAMTYIGSGRAFINNGHIGIDLMDTIVDKKSKDPEKFMKVFNRFSEIITLVFIVLFGVFYFQYLMKMAQRPQESASMHINMLIPMSTILIGVAAGMKSSTICTVAFSGLDSFPLLAVPLFIFAGAIMQHSGIAHALVDLIQSIVGRLRGSLGAVTILTSAAFGILTGSCMATISCIGGIMIPEMKKKGYSDAYCSALAAASSFLGILIPPSVPGIMYGLCAGVSISAVWLSTVGPAICCIILFMLINYFRQGRREEKETTPFVLSTYAGNIGKTFIRAIPALIMPVIIFGGIYGGIFTATEAGAAAVLYGIIFYFVKRAMNKNNVDETFMNMTVHAAVSTATICILIGFSNCSGRVISMIGIAEAIKAFVTTHISSAFGFLIFANILFLICGMLIDINAAILLIVPLLLPTAVAMGVDTIHFGAIILVNLSVGFITPPFCSSVFMAQKLSGARYVDIIKEVMPFVIASLIVVILTTYCPALSTFIPNMVAGAAA